MNKDEYRVIDIRGILFKVYENGDCEYRRKEEEEDAWKVVNW